MAKNQLKTVLLLGLLTGLLVAIGGVLAGRIGLFIGLIIAVSMNFVSYWWSDKIVLAIYRAKKADEQKYPQLYAIIREIAQLQRLPLPKIYILEMPQANAFATGRNPSHAAVAVTTGIMELLNKNELKGVLAHEMGHIKNRDILISSIAATIAGIISYVAMMARWTAIFGMGSRDNDSSNIIELLVLAIIAPLMAMIIKFAISRSREFLADETGAKSIRDGQSLASALEKIGQSVHKHPLRHMGSTEATAHLFIANPFKGKSLLNLFSTHPETAERVRRLRSMRL